ncbi:MAG: hypothetical protein VX589_00975 [Myxococcota bacterium]|nr:hypothetical protein [Myxococcota bacterium]
MKRVGLFAVLLVGCNDVAPGNQVAAGCETGVTIECECPSGGAGVAVCGPMGRFEACGPCESGGGLGALPSAGNGAGGLGQMAEASSRGGENAGGAGTDTLANAPSSGGVTGDFGGTSSSGDTTTEDGRVELTVDRITVTPAQPKVTDLLTCEVANVQPQIDETYPLRLIWRVNGEPTCQEDECSLVDGNTSSLSQPAFRRGDVVDCELSAVDAGFFHGEIKSDPVQIENSAPQIERVEIEPAVVEIGTMMTCQAVGLADADNDDVYVEYTWLADGEVVGDGQVLRADLGPGTQYVCRVTPRDNQDFGASVDGSVAVVSTAPSIAGVRVTPADPFVSDVLVCVHEVPSDPDPGSTLTVTYAWTVNDLPIDGAFDATLDEGLVTRGDSVRCAADVSDGARMSGQVWSDPVVVLNSPPVVGAAVLEPAAPRAGELLTCRSDATRDADGDSILSEAYTWFVNEVSVESDGTSFLSGQGLIAGDTVACEVIVSDGDAASLGVRSNTITVANTPPTVMSVAVTPSEPRVGDELRCAVEQVTDSDGHPVSFRYQWLVDDAIVDGAQTFAAGEVGKGQTVVCIATPNDGFADGEPITSNGVTILNSLPRIESVRIVPEALRAGDTPTCEYTFVDADGDNDVSTISWSVNDADVGSGAQPAARVSGGDRIRCTVTPADGEALGTPVDAEIEVANTPPTVGAVTVEPSMPNTTDGVVCKAVDVDDPDEAQTIEVSYAWRVNGNLVETTGGRLPASETTRGDQLSCTATVRDGFGLPTIVESNVVVVANSKPSISGAYIETEPVYPDSEVRCAYHGFQDVDDDPNQTRYAWYVDDVLQASSTQRLAGPFEVGANIRCKVTPYDGVEEGVARSDEVTVENYTALDARITCTNPMVGDVRTRDAFELTGNVTQPQIITSVSVAYQEANFDTVSGDFSLPIRGFDIEWGLNPIPIVVRDANGVTNRTFCSFFAADTYIPPDTGLNDSVVLAFTQPAIDDDLSDNGAPADSVDSFGDLVREFIESDQLEELIDDNLPVIPAECVVGGGIFGCLFRGGARFSRVSIAEGGNNRTATLRLLANAIRVEMRLRNVRIQGSVQGDLDFGFTATAASVTLRGDFNVFLSNGQLAVGNVRNASVSLGRITIDYANSTADTLLGGVTSWITNFFRGEIASAMRDAIFPTLQNELSAALQGLDLDDIGGTFTLPAFGDRPATDLDLDFKLSRLELTPNLMRLGLSSTFGGPNATVHPAPIGIAMPPSAALIDEPPQNGDMNAAVYLGLINQALFAMWQANVFEIPDLGQLLSTENDVQVDAELDGLGLSLMTPPAVENSDGQIRIHIGPYVGELPSAPGEAARRLRGVAYALATVELRNGALVFGGDDAITIQDADLTIDGVGEDASEQPAFSQEFQALIQEVVADALANVIPSLPIPSFVVDVPGVGAKNLGIRNPAVRRLGNHMVIDGDFGQLP